MKVALGVDTSCYTTSVALCCPQDGDADGFFQLRRPLAVREGARGLMQSEMVFQHVRNLPPLVENIMRAHPEAELIAASASVRPRPGDASYMPAFCVGEGFARGIAAAMGIRYVETTHQEGHIRAALVGTGLSEADSFLALHLSGGTTEMLCVSAGKLSMLGGTGDLSAGQLIDRVGVAMGLPFPAGASMSRLAEAGKAESRLKVAMDGCGCHFSGAEAQALRWLSSGELPKEDIAAEVLGVVARTVARMIQAGAERTGLCDALLSGGVASSGWIGREVRERLAKRNHTIRLHIARPDLSGDNAVGVAMIGMDACGRDGRLYRNGEDH